MVGLTPNDFADEKIIFKNAAASARSIVCPYLERGENMAECIAESREEHVVFPLYN